MHDTCLPKEPDKAAKKLSLLSNPIWLHQGVISKENCCLFHVVIQKSFQNEIGKKERRLIWWQRAKFYFIVLSLLTETQILKTLKKNLEHWSDHFHQIPRISPTPILPVIMLIIYLWKVPSMNYLQHKFDGNSMHHTLVLEAELCRACAVWIDRIWISPIISLCSLMEKTVLLWGRPSVIAGQLSYLVRCQRNRNTPSFQDYALCVQDINLELQMIVIN